MTFICFYICQLMNQEDEGPQIILLDFWDFRVKTRIEAEKYVKNYNTVIFQIDKFQKFIIEKDDLHFSTNNH